MPRIGEIKRAKEIGFGVGNHKFIWLACIDCGKERWVTRQKQSQRCRKCSNAKKGKGGKFLTSTGYIMIRVYPDNFFFSMADHMGYVKEHRLIMAKHLNRCLVSWEIVHHKNGIKSDNRIENLELLPTIKQHLPSIKWQNELNKRDKRITLLEIKVTQLEIKLKEKPI